MFVIYFFGLQFLESLKCRRRHIAVNHLCHFPISKKVLVLFALKANTKVILFEMNENDDNETINGMKIIKCFKFLYLS